MEEIFVNKVSESGILSLNLEDFYPKQEIALFDMKDYLFMGLILKEKGGPVKKKTSILDRGEIESSEGMKWRMNGDQVDLAWVTGVEDDNKGYIVEKRPSYGGDFQEVASFREVSQLVSKGQSGGRLV